MVIFDFQNFLKYVLGTWSHFLNRSLSILKTKRYQDIKS